MNTTLSIVQFDDIPLSIIDHNGEGWFTGEDIGLALEYADDPKNSVRKIFERNRNELEDYSTTVKLTAVDGKERDTRVYNEEGVMMICFFSKQAKAAAFRRFAVKVLKAHRHQELVQQDSAYTQELLDTQRRLIDSQQDQIAYIRQVCEERIAQLQADHKKALTEMEWKWRDAQRKIFELEQEEGYWERQFDKVLRSKRPVGDEEANEILSALYEHNDRTDKVAEDHYRSVETIRKVRRNWYEYNLRGSLRMMLLGMMTGGRHD